MAMGWPGDLFKEGFQIGKFLLEGLFGGDLRHIRMVVSVIAHDMSFFYHPFYQIRGGFQIISHQKEGGRDLMLF